MERRFWYGLGILIFFLVLGLLTAWGMEAMHEPVTGQLEQAAQVALAGDMEQGALLAKKAQAGWEKHRDLTAAAADHGPMEEIDACFAQLEIYCRMKEETAFAAACGETARKAEAMGEAHGLKWENVF